MHCAHFVVYTFVQFLFIIGRVHSEADIPHSKQMFNDITEETFDRYTRDKDVMLIFFYMPWCHHCQAFQPEWEKASKVLEQNKEFVLGRVNCQDSGKSLCDKFQVAMFPDVKLFRHGKFIEEYEGERAAEIGKRTMLSDILEYVQRAQATTGTVGTLPPTVAPPATPQPQMATAAIQQSVQQPQPGEQQMSFQSQPVPPFLPSQQQAPVTEAIKAIEDYTQQFASPQGAGIPLQMSSEEQKVDSRQQQQQQLLNGNTIWKKLSYSIPQLFHPYPNNKPYAFGAKNQVSGRPILYRASAVQAPSLMNSYSIFAKMPLVRENNRKFTNRNEEQRQMNLLNDYMKKISSQLKEKPKKSSQPFWNYILSRQQQLLQQPNYANLLKPMESTIRSYYQWKYPPFGELSEEEKQRRVKLGQYLLTPIRTIQETFRKPSAYLRAYINANTTSNDLVNHFQKYPKLVQEISETLQRTPIQQTMQQQFQPQFSSNVPQFLPQKQAFPSFSTLPSMYENNAGIFRQYFQPNSFNRNFIDNKVFTGTAFVRTPSIPQQFREGNQKLSGPSILSGTPFSQTTSISMSPVPQSGLIGKTLLPATPDISQQPMTGANLLSQTPKSQPSIIVQKPPYLITINQQKAGEVRTSSQQKNPQESQHKEVIQQPNKNTVLIPRLDDSGNLHLDFASRAFYKSVHPKPITRERVMQIQMLRTKLAASSHPARTFTYFYNHNNNNRIAPYENKVETAQSRQLHFVPAILQGPQLHRFYQMQNLIQPQTGSAIIRQKPDTKPISTYLVHPPSLGSTFINPPSFTSTFVKPPSSVPSFVNSPPLVSSAAFTRSPTVVLQLPLLTQQLTPLLKQGPITFNTPYIIHQSQNGPFFMEQPKESQLLANHQINNSPFVTPQSKLNSFFFDQSKDVNYATHKKKAKQSLYPDLTMLKLHFPDKKSFEQKSTSREHYPAPKMFLPTASPSRIVSKSFYPSPKLLPQIYQMLNKQIQKPATAVEKNHIFSPFYITRRVNTTLVKHLQPFDGNTALRIANIRGENERRLAEIEQLKKQKQEELVGDKRGFKNSSPKRNKGVVPLQKPKELHKLPFWNDVYKYFQIKSKEPKPAEKYKYKNEKLDNEKEKRKNIKQLNLVEDFLQAKLSDMDERPSYKNSVQEKSAMYSLIPESMPSWKQKIEDALLETNLENLSTKTVNRKKTTLASNLDKLTIGKLRTNKELNNRKLDKALPKAFFEEGLDEQDGLAQHEIKMVDHRLLSDEIESKNILENQSSKHKKISGDKRSVNPLHKEFLLKALSSKATPWDRRAKVTLHLSKKNHIPGKPQKVLGVWGSLRKKKRKKKKKRESEGDSKHDISLGTKITNNKTRSDAPEANIKPTQFLKVTLDKTYSSPTEKGEGGVHIMKENQHVEGPSLAKMLLTKEEMPQFNLYKKLPFEDRTIPISSTTKTNALFTNTASLESPGLNNQQTASFAMYNTAQQSLSKTPSINNNAQLLENFVAVPEATAYNLDEPTPMSSMTTQPYARTIDMRQSKHQKTTQQNKQQQHEKVQRQQYNKFINNIAQQQQQQKLQQERKMQEQYDNFFKTAQYQQQGLTSTDDYMTASKPENREKSLGFIDTGVKTNTATGLQNKKFVPSQDYNDYIEGSEHDNDYIETQNFNNKDNIEISRSKITSPLSTNLEDDDVYDGPPSYSNDSPANTMTDSLNDGQALQREAALIEAKDPQFIRMPSETRPGEMLDAPEGRTGEITDTPSAMFSQGSEGGYKQEYKQEEEPSDLSQQRSLTTEQQAVRMQLGKVNYPNPKRYGYNYFTDRQHEEEVRRHENQMEELERKRANKQVLYPKPVPFKYKNNSKLVESEKKATTQQPQPLKVKVKFEPTGNGQYIMRFQGPVMTANGSPLTSRGKSAALNIDGKTLSVSNKAVPMIQEYYKAQQQAEGPKKQIVNYYTSRPKEQQQQQQQRTSPTTSSSFEDALSSSQRLDHPNSPPVVGIDNSRFQQQQQQQQQLQQKQQQGLTIDKTFSAFDKLTTERISANGKEKTVSIKLPVDVSLSTVLRNIYQRMYEAYFHQRPSSQGTLNDETASKIIDNLVNKDLQNMSRFTASSGFANNLLIQPLPQQPTKSLQKFMTPMPANGRLSSNDEVKKMREYFQRMYDRQVQVSREFQQEHNAASGRSRKKENNFPLIQPTNLNQESENLYAKNFQQIQATQEQPQQQLPLNNILQSLPTTSQQQAVQPFQQQQGQKPIEVQQQNIEGAARLVQPTGVLNLDVVLPPVVLTSPNSPATINLQQTDVQKIPLFQTVSSAPDVVNKANPRPETAPPSPLLRQIIQRSRYGLLPQNEALQEQRAIVTNQQYHTYVPLPTTEERSIKRAEVKDIKEQDKKQNNQKGKKEKHAKSHQKHQSKENTPDKEPIESYLKRLDYLKESHNVNKFNQLADQMLKVPLSVIKKEHERHKESQKSSVSPPVMNQKDRSPKVNSLDPSKQYNSQQQQQYTKSAKKSPGVTSSNTTGIKTSSLTYNGSNPTVVKHYAAQYLSVDTTNSNPKVIQNVDQYMFQKSIIHQQQQQQQNQQNMLQKNPYINYYYQNFGTPYAYNTYSQQIQQPLQQNSYTTITGLKRHYIPPVRHTNTDKKSMLIKHNSKLEGTNKDSVVINPDGKLVVTPTKYGEIGTIESSEIILAPPMEKYSNINGPYSEPHAYDYKSQLSLAYHPLSNRNNHEANFSPPVESVHYNSKQSLEDSAEAQLKYRKSNINSPNQIDHSRQNEQILPDIFNDMRKRNQIQKPERRIALKSRMLMLRKRSVITPTHKKSSQVNINNNVNTRIKPTRKKRSIPVDEKEDEGTTTQFNGSESKDNQIARITTSDVPVNQNKRRSLIPQPKIRNSKRRKNSMKRKRRLQKQLSIQKKSPPGKQNKFQRIKKSNAPSEPKTKKSASLIPSFSQASSWMLNSSFISELNSKYLEEARKIQTTETDTGSKTYTGEKKSEITHTTSHPVGKRARTGKWKTVIVKSVEKLTKGMERNAINNRDSQPSEASQNYTVAVENLLRNHTLLSVPANFAEPDSATNSYALAPPEIETGSARSNINDEVFNKSNTTMSNQQLFDDEGMGLKQKEDYLNVDDLEENIMQSMERKDDENNKRKKSDVPYDEKNKK